MGEGARSETDFPARMVGMVIFLLGLVLLILVFAWAFGMFSALGRSATRQGLELVDVGFAGLRVLLLLVMGYVASLIATKGIQLYGVGRGISTTR
jgi:hypothetical protein